MIHNPQLCIEEQTQGVCKEQASYNIIKVNMATKLAGVWKWLSNYSRAHVGACPDH